MTNPDDALTRFEAALGAISKMTASGEEGLVGARCPKCGASNFIKASDLYSEALVRLEEPGTARGTQREGGMTDPQIIQKFKPPQRKSAVGRVLLVAVPLAIGVYFLYRRFGGVAGEVGAAAAGVVTIVVFMTSLRRLSDDYYVRRRRWNSLYVCRQCGQVVAA